MDTLTNGVFDEAPAADNDTALAIYFQSYPVPYRFNAGIVVASIAVSVLGSYTTLLILSRRTGTAGLKNWALLLLAATTMVSVGIWSMHFLGMNMALVASPQVTWYIQFNPGFTTFSLVAPLVVLALTFVFVGAGPDAIPFPISPLLSRPAAAGEDRMSINEAGPKRIWRALGAVMGLRLVSGGFLLGGTVAFMHYSAGFSASFRPVYSPAQVACAIILACVASTAALVIFFRLQSHWQDNWWMRLLCASVLASAVCGMHYLGISGTQWFVPKGRTSGFTLGKRNSTVLSVAISVMCFVLCVLCAIFLFSDYLMRKDSRRRAKRVTVASATFDKAGRLLVKPDGMLPISVIETSMPLKDTVAELDYRQSTFQWLYTLSWDWSIVESLIPHIFARTLGFAVNERHRKSSPSRKSKDLASFGSLFSISKNSAQAAAFHDRCIEATHLLANELCIPMSKMGVLFDNVLRTGKRIINVPTKAKGREGAIEKDIDDKESLWNIAPPVPEHEGVMLFLVRELTDDGQDTHDYYSRRGYRFADTRYFSPVLADRVGVSKPEIDGLFEQLKVYARRGTKPCVRPAGVYVGLFGVRPSISRQGGLDTLVYSFCHHQVPAYRLPDVNQITDEMRGWIASLAGATLRDVVTLCEQDPSLDHDVGGYSDPMSLFRSSLALGITAMLTNLKMFSNLDVKARLAAEIVDMPSSMDDSTEPARFVMFEAVFPAPVRAGVEVPGMPKELSCSFRAQEPSPTFIFVPYSLFAKSQMMVLRGARAKKFAKEVRAEIQMRYQIPADSLHQMAPSGSQIVNSFAKTSAEKFGCLGLHPDSPALDKLTLSQREAQEARRRGSVCTTSTLRSVKSSNDIFERSGPTQNLMTLIKNIDGGQVTSCNGTTTAGSGIRYATTNSSRTPLDAAAGLFFPAPVSSPAAARIRDRSWTGLSEVAPGSTFRIRSIPIQTGPQSGDAMSSKPPSVVTGAMSMGSISSAASPCRMSRRESHLSSASSSSGIEVARSQPMWVNARLRADDWHLRALYSMERSDAGGDLLGVEW